MYPNHAGPLAIQVIGTYGHSVDNIEHLLAETSDMSDVQNLRKIDQLLKDMLESIATTSQRLF